MVPMSAARIYNTHPNRQRTVKIQLPSIIARGVGSVSIFRARVGPQNLNSIYIIIYMRYRLAPTNTAASPKLISVFRPAPPVYG